MREKRKSKTSHLLVAAGKSSRLDAIRKKAELQFTGAHLNKKPKKQAFVTGTDQIIKEALQQAQSIIETRISSIIDAYPASKKNTFFKFKYGISVENLKQMALQDIFKKLELDFKNIKHYSLIEKLYLDGKTADAK